MGGAAVTVLKEGTYLDGVSIAGAILWGVLLATVVSLLPARPVSIAGAILWGVLRGVSLGDVDGCLVE